MIANLLIPCLSIAEIIKSFNIKEWDMWLPILIVVVLCVFTGWVIGTIVNLVIKSPKEIKNLTLVTFMFSNSTSSQLIYVESLADILTRITGMPASCILI